MRIKKLKQGFGKLTVEKARIIAHSIGDGCVFRTGHDYTIKYEVSDLYSLNSFEQDMFNVYGLKLSKGFNPSGKTGKPIPFVRLRSLLAYNDLLRYATYSSKDWKIGDSLLKSPKLIKKEFLKALFDDEGSVFKQRKRGVIRLYSINLNGLVQVKEMLHDFNIQSVIKSGFGYKRNVYAIEINDLKSFYTLLGFNLKRKQDKLKSLLLNKE